jgi:hypothetical protein
MISGCVTEAVREELEHYLGGSILTNDCFHRRPEPKPGNVLVFCVIGCHPGRVYDASKYDKDDGEERGREKS